MADCRFNCDDGTLEYYHPNSSSAIQTHGAVASCPDCADDQRGDGGA